MVNYTAMVTAAANEAGGNAFIAEYAGTASVMANQLWPNTVISLPALRAATTPPVFLQLVLQQSLLTYGPMLPLLRKYIPEPQVLINMGITESQFYNNNATYWAQYQSSFAAFDPVVITAEIQAKIVDPLQAAQTLFDTHAYLTRLATFISPEEMTKDPEFVFNRDLPDAVQPSHRHRARHVRRAGLHLLPGARFAWTCPRGGWSGISAPNCGFDRHRVRQHCRRSRWPTCAPRPARDSP